MQNGCVRTKKIASDFVPVGGLQPPSTEGLTRSPAPYHERIGHARSAAKLVALVSLVHLVSLVYPVSLVQANKRDKPNKPVAPPVSRDTFHVSRFTGLLP